MFISEKHEDPFTVLLYWSTLIDPLVTLIDFDELLNLLFVVCQVQQLYALLLSKLLYLFHTTQLQTRQMQTTKSSKTNKINKFFFRMMHKFIRLGPSAKI